MAAEQPNHDLLLLIDNVDQKIINEQALTEYQRALMEALCGYDQLKFVAYKSLTRETVVKLFGRVYQHVMEFKAQQVATDQRLKLNTETMAEDLIGGGLIGRADNGSKIELRFGSDTLRKEIGKDWPNDKEVAENLRRQILGKIETLLSKIEDSD